MSAENKAIVRRLSKEWHEAQRPEVGEELLADDFIDRSAGPGEDDTKQGAIQYFHYLWAALPDLSVQIKDQVAEGDKVATLKTFSGTHRGELMGVPATGKQVTFEIFDLLRLRDGKVVEHWGVYDVAGLMQQLGAMPGSDGCLLLTHDIGSCADRFHVDVSVRPRTMGRVAISRLTTLLDL